MTRDPQQYAGGRGDLVVVVDCSDLERSAAFWNAVLGYVSEGEPEGSYLALVPADGQGVEVMLQLVPDGKTTKNRVHLDLRARDLPTEIARVLAAGATQLTQQPHVEDGWSWHVLADPDGNEFCVLQPAPDYWEGREG